MEEKQYFNKTKIDLDKITSDELFELLDTITCDIDTSDDDTVGDFEDEDDGLNENFELIGMQYFKNNQ